MATSLMVILTGILRYFPNTMLVTTIVIGLLTARLNWILIGVGGVLLSMFVLTLQYMFLRTLNIGEIPGAGVIEACTLLPVAAGGEFSALPSIWMALTTFFAAYIITNAAAIYSAPAKQAPTTIPVQQRKGLGLISILATVLLWLFLVIPRATTGCETIFGSLLGILIGGAVGYGWWHLLFACFQPVWPDIHGVMIGTAPGVLRVGPLVCAPKK